MKKKLLLLLFPVALILCHTQSYAQSLDFGDDFFDEKNNTQTKPKENQPSVETGNLSQQERKPNQNPSESNKTQADPQNPNASDQSNITKKILGDKTISDQKESIDQRAASRVGSIGLLDTISADTGIKGSFRFRLTTGGFSTTDFLNAKADKSLPEAQRKESFSLSHLSVAYSPLSFLELWGSIKGSSYRNALVQPNLMQSFGDSHLGAKVSHFWHWFGLGFASQLNFLSDNQSSGINWSATGADLRLLLTFDFKRAQNPLPIRFLLDVQYTIENGATLYRRLSEEPSISYEWGTQAWRYNRLLVNTGLEFPTQWVSPFIEYHIGTPFQVDMLRIGKGAQPFSFEGIPHWLTLGLRTFPLPEIAIDLSYQHGFSNAPATGVMPTPPWSFWFALSYTLDPKPVIIERSVEIKAEKPMGTAFKAQIIEDQSKKPIVGATISYGINGLSPQNSDSNGNINGYLLPQQELKMVISAPMYQSKEVKVKIPNQSEFKVKISLKPIDIDQQNEIKLFVTSGSNKIAAQLISMIPLATDRIQAELLMQQQKSAQAYRKLSVTEQGLTIKLMSGDYLADVSVNGTDYQIKFTLSPQAKELLLAIPQGSITSALEEDTSNEARTKGSQISQGSRNQKPQSTASIKVKGKQIIPNQPILFIGDREALEEGSMNTISQLSDFLKSNTGLKLKIEVHTHLLGSAEESMSLSQARATSLVTAFAQNGISKSRLQIKAMGAKKNIASNISQRGKLQNQRILFSW